MNGKDLFAGLSFIDERFIAEAETFRPGMMRSWPRITALAACLCLVLFSLWCIQPIHGSIPETTAPDDPFLPEGFPAVIVYVEKMTDNGFIGTVADPVMPDLFEAGMALDVITTDHTQYVWADGSCGTFGDQQIDCSGFYVLVECIEYNPDTASVVAGYLTEVHPPETTPQKG